MKHHLKVFGILCSVIGAPALVAHGLGKILDALMKL